VRHGFVPHKISSFLFSAESSHGRPVVHIDASTNGNDTALIDGHLEGIH
jgi:hypothetical protein